jgi:hypothetical protein
MKNITKISGIINLLAAITLLIFDIIVFFENNGSDDRIISILLLIPLFFLFQFLIRYKIGFDNSINLDVKYKNLLFVIFAAITSISLLFGSIISFIYVKGIIEEDKLIKLHSNVIEWPQDTTAYNLVANLKTKYNDGYIQYKLSINSDSTNLNKLDQIANYTINLLDKDGFIIDEIRINQFIRILNKQSIPIGHEVNSQSIKKIKDYARMKNWSLTVYDR